MLWQPSVARHFRQQTTGQARGGPLGKSLPRNRIFRALRLLMGSCHLHGGAVEQQQQASSPTPCPPRLSPSSTRKPLAVPSPPTSTSLPYGHPPMAQPRRTPFVSFIPSWIKSGGGMPANSTPTLSNQHPRWRVHARPLSHGLNASDRRLSGPQLDCRGSQPSTLSAGEHPRGSHH